MDSWNPNLYFKEGEKRNYSEPYLEELVANGKKIQANGFPVVFSLAHLASLSSALYSELHQIATRSVIPSGDYPYKNFTISKRSGGVRWINVPAPPLMAVQRWIAINILNKAGVHPASRAYHPGAKTLNNARPHCGSDWLLKLDIRDFFGNISELQVFEVFAQMGYPRLLCLEMARLCTRVAPNRRGRRWRYSPSAELTEPYPTHYVGSLPQGAPTSPGLSNIVMRPIDASMAALAEEFGATYTRYADDLCFSLIKADRERVDQLRRRATRILWDSGFSDNRKKTRIIPPGGRKIITGLVVNDKVPRLPRELRDSIRMHLYFCQTRGIPAHCQERGFRSIVGFRNFLLGLVVYANSIDRRHGSRYLAAFERLPWADYEV